MMTKRDKIKAPEHLRPSTAAWFVEVCQTFDLEEHHRRLLRLACEAWDTAQEAREAIAVHGMVYVDRFDQPRARPEVGIARDARTQFARLVRELGLDLSEPEEVRPPSTVGKTIAKGI